MKLAKFGDQHLEPELEGAGEARRAVGDDLVAGVGERARRLRQRGRIGGDGAMPPRSSAAIDDRDADRRRVAGPISGTGHPPRIARIVLRHRLEAEAHVAHASARAVPAPTSAARRSCARALPVGLYAGTRPNDGRNPTRPVQYAG